MKNNYKTMILIMILLVLTPVINLAAQELELGELVKKALDENSDIASSLFDLESERLSYESAKAGTLPSLGFTTDAGNNPLYKYSNANEFSFDGFTTKRYQRQQAGGGLSLGADLPTGGSFSITGTGSLGFSLVEDSEDWKYYVNPSASLFLRQPLFTDRINGSLLRFDSMKLADELAGLGVVQAEIAKKSIENNLIIAIARTSVILNNLRNTYEVLTNRLELAQKRLELALQDEQAGKLNSLDRLAEELLIRRQQEALIELNFQIESAELDLQQLTGIKDFKDKDVLLEWGDSENAAGVNPLSSLSVLSSEAVSRSLELAGTVVPNGSEPVFELSGLLRRSTQDEALEIGSAFEEAAADEIDLSVSLSLSFDLVDWGETRKQREADKSALMAAQKRLEAAEKTAELQTAAAIRNLILIEEKFVLLQQSFEYDESLLEREQVRFEAGLTSELALETIILDRKEREYQIKQLNDEKYLAMLELYNTGGLELKALF